MKDSNKLRRHVNIMNCLPQTSDINHLKFTTHKNEQSMLKSGLEIKAEQLPYVVIHYDSRAKQQGSL